MPFTRQAQGLRPRLRVIAGVDRTPPYVSLRNASHSNKHKKLDGLREAQASARSGLCGAAFGKRQRHFWKSIAPDFVKQDTRYSKGSSHFAEASSFQIHASHKPGSKPVFEATSASWDSRSNEVKHSVYDPISGRMVPAVGNQTKQKSTSPNDHTIQTPIEPYQNPTAASKLANHSSIASNAPTAHAAFTEDFDKSYPSEHDELLATRRHLETLREQVQILERQIHPELNKPAEALDAERPSVFEDGWDSDPKGLQTAFEHEKEACEHGDMKPLEQELAALNTEQVQEINDGYSAAPSGMQTLFAHEQEVDDIARESSLEQEMAAMNTQALPIEDGYEGSPKGLQTLFEQEKQETEYGQRQSLEDEVKAPVAADTAPTYDDGYGTKPVGLQTLYEKEQQSSPEKLEHELIDQTPDPAVKDPEDAYSTEPIGMQTLYEREEADYQNGQRQDLEHELHDQLHPHGPGDVFSTEPKGMQTLWDREQEGIERGSTKSLEAEIQTHQQPLNQTDGYSTVPTGMQNQFHKERQDIGVGTRALPEDEISRKEQAQEYDDDGYSRLPIGLETAFDAEERDAMRGRRQTLENEMNSRGPSFEDGYSTMPAGLQILFRRENHDTAQGSRRSLEDDIKQMEHASNHEDGYSCAPMGLQSSFETEKKTKYDNLEAELKSIPGEGDLSPSVGKFATSNKWYKQPARSMFSEDTQKADNHEHEIDAALLQVLQAEKSSGPDNISTDFLSKGTPTNKLSTASPSRGSLDTAVGTCTSDIKWAEPPLYKVVAYDVSKDAISIMTTSSNVSDCETPISVSNAVDMLEHAGRFIPHLASLQNDGFQVLHARRDFLILRKVHKDSWSRSSRLGGAMNPVDGTTKPPPIEPPTARFASPTGFVNHDPVFPPDPVGLYKDSTGTAYDIPDHGCPKGGIQDWGHTEVRRQFDETARVNRKNGRGRWRRRTTWILSVATGTLVCTYVVGVAAELARPEKHVMRSSK